MEQNLKKCPLCGKEFDENTDDYGFDIIIDGKQEHVTEILLPNDEKIMGLCSQCLKAAAYGCARLQDCYGNRSWWEI